MLSQLLQWMFVHVSSCPPCRGKMSWSCFVLQMLSGRLVPSHCPEVTETIQTWFVQGLGSLEQCERLVLFGLQWDRHRKTRVRYSE